MTENTDATFGESQARRLESISDQLTALLRRPDVTQRLHNPAGENEWSAMQVIGHMVEMIPYWLNHCRAMMAATAEPPHFGRSLDAPERLAPRGEFAEHVVEPPVRNAEVDEAGAGDLGRPDPVRGGERRDEVGCDLARRRFQNPRELQREIGRVVAVRRIARPFERDQRRGLARGDGGERAGEEAGEVGADFGGHERERTRPVAGDVPPAHRPVRWKGAGL